MKYYKMVIIIVAVDVNFAIGYKGQLLTHIPDDLARFKHLTTGHTVIMGRKTFESLPDNMKPLPDRRNIIISRNKDYIIPGCSVFGNLEDALYAASEDSEVYIIGGAELYKYALDKNLVDRIELTLIEHSFENADTYFPDFSINEWVEIKRENLESKPYACSFRTFDNVKRLAAPSLPYT